MSTLKIKNGQGQWEEVPYIKGDSGTIAIGTTTTGAAGTSASVTNTGSSTAAVFNFTIPRGADGQTGPQGPQGPTFTGGLLTSGLFEHHVAMAANDIDLSLGNCFSQTITSNRTFTISNAQGCSSFALVLTNGGAWTLTYPASCHWDDNLPPDLAVSGVDIILFLSPDAGTTWYGIHALSSPTVGA